MKPLYRTLIPLFLATLAVRLAFTLLNGDAPLVAEMAAYWDAAGRLLAGEGFHAGHGFRAFIPPGYVWFIAAFRYCGGTPLTVRLSHAFLAGGTAICLYLFTRRNFDDRTAAVAAYAFALWPPSLAIGDFLLTETLFTFLLWVTLNMWGRGRSWPGALAAGLVCGAATLTRELTLYFFPTVAFVSVAKRDWAVAGRATAAAAVVALCVAPWTARNYRVLGGVVPVSSKTAVDFFIYNHNSFRQILTNESDQPSEQALFKAARTEYELTSSARRRALEWITSHPGLFILKGIRTTMNFLGLERDYFQHQRYGYFRPLPPAFNAALLPVFLFPSAVATWLAFLAALRFGDRPGLRAALSLTALYFIITFVAYSFTRQRYPLTPLMLALAAAVVTSRTATLAWLKTRRGPRIAAVIFGAFLVSAWGLEVFLDARDFFYR